MFADRLNGRLPPELQLKMAGSGLSWLAPGLPSIVDAMVKEVEGELPEEYQNTSSLIMEWKKKGSDHELTSTTLCLPAPFLQESIQPYAHLKLGQEWICIAMYNNSSECIGSIEGIAICISTSLVPRPRPARISLPARDTESDPRWGCMVLGLGLRLYKYTPWLVVSLKHLFRQANYWYKNMGLSPVVQLSNYREWLATVHLHDCKKGIVVSTSHLLSEFQVSEHITCRLVKNPKHITAISF